MGIGDLFGPRSRSNRNKKTQSVPDEEIVGALGRGLDTRLPAWATLDLFHDVSEVDLRAISDALSPVDFSKDDVIMSQGATGDDMFLLERGQVRIEVAQTDASPPFSTVLDAPTALGEMAMVTSEPRTATVLAHTPVRCMRIGRRGFDKLVSQHPAVASVLTRLVGERLKEIQGIRRVGKYEIVGVLGKGNVADVFEAIHPELGQTVALKMLSHSLVHDSQFGIQFDHEAQIVASLDHPNIVRVFDFERAYGTRFTVMERLEGEQLEQLIYRSPRLGWDRIRRIIYEVGSALHYAHRKGLIHRDVKPSNIFLTNQGPTKLLDFGIAIDSESSSAENKARLGSPCYMPPEQILGKELDGRADMYALGMTAYEMIAGEVPFNEQDIRVLLRRQLYEKTPDVRQSVHDAPDDLVQFIRGCTAKEVSERFKDLLEAVSVLKRNQPSTPLIQAERVKLVIHHGLESTEKVDAALDRLFNSLREHPDVIVQVKRS